MGRGFSRDYRVFPAFAETVAAGVVHFKAANLSTASIASRRELRQ
jgi:hypothetical protein